jgi:probable H4MPT-linked C1 transfer pathway protein
VSCERSVIGWDVGGAHLKACLLADGRVRDVAQWPCALWQGIDRLDAALAQARMRWPQMERSAHAITMTGEMADVFEHREHGVQRIAERMAAEPGIALALYAGEGGWCSLDDVSTRWEDIASANWLATARLAARRVGDGVLVDIGSTTTDVIALRRERVAARGRSDAGRLATGELVYQGVVRTPLCALTRQIRFRGESFNVMNEFFATTADIYRLTGELDPAHDLHPAADGGAKDMAATRRRLARMVGMDARDGHAQEWLAFALAWRGHQLAETVGQLQRVVEQAAVPAEAPLVSAGCGSFLVRELSAQTGRRCMAFAGEVVTFDRDAGADVVAAAQVCAPSVAVALLFDEERR